MRQEILNNLMYFCATMGILLVMLFRFIPIPEFGFIAFLDFLLILGIFGTSKTKKEKKET